MMKIGGKRVWRGVGVAVFLAILSVYATGCSSTETARLTPTPTKTPRPTFTPVPVEPTSTHTPTATLTPVPEPTEAPTVTPTSRPTSTPVPTETPQPSVTPWPTHDPNACPLTGLAVSDPALLDRRPLAIKVQNAPLSRPQFGLPRADIVYEHLSEAGITRFTGIYLCQDVAKIGSVRSARFIDLEIPAMYKSLMALSGTSPGLLPKFEDSDFSDRLFWYDRGINSAGFYRDTELRKQGLPIEHTLFGDPAKIWEIAGKKEINQPQELQGLTFDHAVPEGGVQGATLHLPYPHRDMVVDYRYDVESGTYLRTQGGKPFIDAATGEQISVTNVVVLYATHVDADFFEDFPRTNHPSVQIQVWGTGPAVVFRDGLAYEGLWARPQRDDMIVFRDPTGQVPISLKPGNTWIQLVPLEGHRWSFEATWGSEE